MKKILNLINNFKFLNLFIVIFIMARPAYSIPTTIEELKKSIGSICVDLGIDFCTVKEEEVRKKKKPRKFTETEQKILTRLADQQKKLSARSVEYLVREKKGPQKVGQTRVDANVLEEQRQMEENLGMKVDIINKKNNSGRLTINYTNLEQFQLISKLLKQR